ncbi:hypothetical protein EVAR_27615_1 [Eumeta japonica]|uniref:Uncharacterized protein n=1 Tax=Eumeta variegata TaxID=151549 RepID=A0A4C1V1N4_EUMVA|nr:hypothetical protein EVAR_27615_1 [Eumeta japonica]
MLYERILLKPRLGGERIAERQRSRAAAIMTKASTCICASWNTAATSGRDERAKSRIRAILVRRNTYKPACVDRDNTTNPVLYTNPTHSVRGATFINDHKFLYSFLGIALRARGVSGG